MRRLLAALICVLAPSPAAAHLSQSVTHTSRFVEVTASGTEVRIRYAVGFGQVPAALERRRMDVDHDGELTSSERDLWRESMERRLGRQVRVSLSGRAVPLAFTGKLHMSDTRLGEIAFAAEFSARVPLGRAGALTLTIADRYDPPRPGELEVRFLEDLGARFVESWRSEGEPGRRRSFTFRGPRRSEMEERRVSFRFEADPARVRAAAASVRANPGDGSRPGWSAARIAIVAGVVAAGGIAGAVFLLRRRGRL